MTLRSSGVLISLCLCFAACSVPPASQNGNLSLEELAPAATTELERQLSSDAVLFRQSLIEMPDGVELAADLYLPAGASSPVPVLLELLPYRKDEDRAYRYSLYSYFVERDYAVARVDIRGTGNSEGTLPSYEYSVQELDDAVALILWLAEQPWSSGKVGMWGISWGGFNAIQVGMRPPEPLAAILAACATDDLFYDDVHYVDGMMHIDHYEINQDLMNAVTGSPSLALDDALLEQRFDTEPWIIRKLEHQQDGPFWDRGSLDTDYSKLRVPALLLGGLYDGYRDSVPRMLENVDVPVQAVLGPWPHRYPHDAVPGPRVEWRDRAVRWFDHFLKGIDNGVLEDPKLIYYLRDAHPPDPELAIAPGTWRSATTWPPDGVVDESWTLGQAGLSLGNSKDDPQEIDVLELPYEASVGLEAGTWWGDTKGDQAPLDEHGLVFDSPPLATRKALFGMPRTRLRVSADAPLANWFVRLSDVAPDGRTTLVTGAGMSGAHRSSQGEPQPLVPGEVFDLDVELHLTSWTFEPGHRIRIVVSNAQWPMVWPTPYAMTTRLYTGPSVSSVVLPVLDERVPSVVPVLAEPVDGPEYPIPVLEIAPVSTPSVPSPKSPWAHSIDPATGDAVLVWQSGYDSLFPWGRRRDQATVEYRVNDERPAEASVIASSSRRYELPARQIEWRGELTLRSDAQSIHYEYTRTLLENGKQVRDRSWVRSFARHLH